MMELKLPNFGQSHVLVIGDLMLDRYWTGTTSRVSPEAPVPIVHVKQTEERPGGAGNVALNIVSLGAKVTLLGMCGDDAAGAILENQLKQAHINTCLLKLKNIPTVTKLRILSRHQQLLRMDFEETFYDQDSSELIKLYEDNIKTVGAVILSDYGKGTLACIDKLIAIAIKYRIPVFVDPKTHDFARYAGATMITPNYGEFEAAAGKCVNEEDMVAKGRALMQKHHIESLLITRGEKGMTLLNQQDPEVHLPAREREVYDVTGAGDTVIAVMAAAIAAGANKHDAMMFSNIAAGIVVGKLGAATVSLPELMMVIQTGRRVDTGVMNETQLMLAVHEARVRGEKIVMTNGCFDILHVGHIAYLKQAKALGDRLIIAVNDDQSVKKLKGPGRPINNVDQRMVVLSSLETVDWVVPFSEDTPARLICKVLPDVLVKGGDYKVEQVAGHEAVLANSGEVKILTFVDDVSTTNMINKINHRMDPADKPRDDGNEMDPEALPRDDEERV